MNQSNNSHNFDSQLSKNSGMRYTDRASEILDIYEGTGVEFIPPEHKYIELEKYKSPFFRDNNEEEYIIQRAFQPNNFNYLRDLPDNISRNCILDQRKERVKGQILDQTTKRMRTPLESEHDRRVKIEENKKTKIGSLGYFQQFTYKQSDYELPKKLANEQRVQSTKKRKDICDKDFRPVGFDRKMKYQDPFRYIDRLDATTDIIKGEKYLFPFHLPEDVYDSFKESERRRKIVERELTIAGQFLPAQKQYSLNTVSKAKMPQILNQIQYYFKKFLKGDYGYFIGVNKRDYIEVMFQQRFSEDPKLQMAMSGILEHEILSKFVLRRNFEKWGNINQRTGYLQFVILPPWVKDPEEKLRAPTAPTNVTQSRGKE